MQKLEAEGLLNPKRFASDGQSRKVAVNAPKDRLSDEATIKLEAIVREQLHPIFKDVNLY